MYKRVYRIGGNRHQRWSQPTVRVFSPHGFWGGHGRHVFLKTEGGSGKGREGVPATHGVVRGPHVTPGRERLRASYVAHVVSALYVLTTCLQRTVSVRLPPYRTEAVLTRAAHVRCPYSLARCKCVHVRLNR